MSTHQTHYLQHYGKTPSSSSTMVLNTQTHSLSFSANNHIKMHHIPHKMLVVHMLLRVYTAARYIFISFIHTCATW